MVANLGYEVWVNGAMLECYKTFAKAVKYLNRLHFSPCDTELIEWENAGGDYACIVEQENFKHVLD